MQFKDFFLTLVYFQSIRIWYIFRTLFALYKCMNSLFDSFELQEDFMAAGIIKTYIGDIYTNCRWPWLSACSVISDTASSENHSKNSWFFLATARNIQQPLAKTFFPRSCRCCQEGAEQACVTYWWIKCEIWNYSLILLPGLWDYLLSLTPAVPFGSSPWVLMLTIGLGCAVWPKPPIETFLCVCSSRR